MNHTVTERVSQARGYLAATVATDPGMPPAELADVTAGYRRHLAAFVAALPRRRPRWARELEDRLDVTDARVSAIFRMMSEATEGLVQRGEDATHRDDH